MKRKLVVIPSDPLSAYEKKGNLQKMLNEDYFNPDNAFDRVIFLSPLEPIGSRIINNIMVIGEAGLDYLEILNNINPTLVRGYGGFWACDHAIYSTCIACPNTPVYISVHDTKKDLLYNSIIYADKIHCTSKVVQDLVISRGVDEKYTVVVPNYVNLNEFYPQRTFSDNIEKLNLPSDCSPILHVGRKREQKNLETVIAALRYLPDRYMAIFVGQGDEKKYQMIADKLNVSNRCRWIPKSEHEELPKWYSWCKVMCTPSRWEGFGIVFIEALACGSRIVTSDIAPMNEYLENNVNSVLVKDYESPSEIANAILKYEDEEFSNFISQNAIIASNKFKREIVQALESQEMLNTKKRVLSVSDAYMLRKKSIQYYNSWIKLCQK